MKKYNPDGTEESVDVYFHSKNRRLLSIEEFEENYVDAVDGIDKKLGEYMVESSGWIMDSITAVNLNIAKYKPIRGSSHIETPARIIIRKQL